MPKQTVFAIPILLEEENYESVALPFCQICLQNLISGSHSQRARLLAYASQTRRQPSNCRNCIFKRNVTSASTKQRKCARHIPFGETKRILGKDTLALTVAGKNIPDPTH